MWIHGRHSESEKEKSYCTNTEQCKWLKKNYRYYEFANGNSDKLIKSCNGSEYNLSLLNMSFWNITFVRLVRL